MKRLTELKEFEIKINQNVEQLDLLINESISKIRKEYKQNLYEIIMEICINENLDFDTIKNKYIKTKEIDKKIEESDEYILDKIVINNIEYYYEPKEKGIVYDNKLNKVGIFENGNIKLN